MERAFSSERYELKYKKSRKKKKEQRKVICEDLESSKLINMRKRNMNMRKRKMKTKEER